MIRTVAEEPYQISKRPMPGNGNADTLLPVMVNNFKRGTVTQNYNTFSTVYTDGVNTIDAQALAFEKSANAQAFIADLRAYDTSLIVSSTGSDPSYAANERQGQATILTYTRGQYAFHFKANSASALAVFLVNFPF